MKLKRQTRIIEIINEYSIETQDELVEKLKNEGFSATQATVSRDIRELKLKKTLGENGHQKYTVPTKEENEFSKRLGRVFKDGIISIEQAQNIVVIKTLDGMAMGVAAALDAMKNSEILGSIAGDDTIFCAAISDKLATRFIRRMKKGLED